MNNNIMRPQSGNQNHAYAIDGGVLSFQQRLWPKMRTLTHLDLSNCKISVLPEALCDLIALKFLQASNNLLTFLPTSFGGLKSLSKLILPHNKLSQLPASFAELRSLEVLNISNNEFRSVPTCFQEGAVKITYFDISHNQIEDWSTGPMCGHALKYLNCSYNCLQSNPSWLWKDYCHSLEELDLSFNLLSNASQMVKTYTPWRTGVTVRLKKLRLHQSGISTPHVNLVHQLKALESLDLGNTEPKQSRTNFIWEISFKPFESRGVLTELVLCRLGLSSLPDDINCLEALEVLNCDGNGLQWLPDSFCELAKLRVAVFSNNLLLYLPNNFGKLSNLQELLLDGNQIGELPSSCSDLHRLKWLDLYKNYLESVPPFLEINFNNLLGLDLELNYFNTLSCESISSNYKALKGAMRKHLQTGVIRLNGLQKPEVYNDSSDSNADGLSDSESISSNSDSEDLAQSPALNVSHDGDEEDWDLDDGQDDYYDPTIKQTTTFLPMPKRALIIHEVVLHAGSFLPSDIHPSPSIRASKDPFIPYDGQFEDA